jgi:hypothetical protein
MAMVFDSMPVRIGNVRVFGSHDENVGLNMSSVVVLHLYDVVRSHDSQSRGGLPGHSNLVLALKTTSTPELGVQMKKSTGREDGSGRCATLCHCANKKRFRFADRYHIGTNITLVLKFTNFL